MPVSVRFIDPSYMIRSVPAHSDDSMYCVVGQPGRSGASFSLCFNLLVVIFVSSDNVHRTSAYGASFAAGAMAGLTGFTVGLVNNRVYIPTSADRRSKRVNKGRVGRVLMMTRQPLALTHPATVPRIGRAGPIAAAAGGSRAHDRLRVGGGVCGNVCVVGAVRAWWLVLWL